MEIKPPGESWIADKTAEVDQWLYLLDQHLATWLGTYTAVILILAALVGVGVVYYMLARPKKVGPKLSVTFATAVGLAFIVQGLLAVKVPSLAEGYGFGYTKSCQVFERDENGKLIYDPYQVVVEGEKKTAMIARKILYMVDSPPVGGPEKGKLTLGFLLVEASRNGEFPTFCGLPYNQDARDLLENIQMQKRPVPVDIIFEALLMQKGGYQAYELTTKNRSGKKDPDEINPGVQLFLQHLASQLQIDDILPLTAEGLVRVMTEAGETTSYLHVYNIPTRMKALLNKELTKAGLSDEDAGRVSRDWMNSIGRYESLIGPYIKGEKDPADALPPDLVLFTLANYAVGRNALLDMMDSVIRQLNLRLSGLYASEVVRIIEELKLHERKPLIVLPGSPPYYLTDPMEGEGEGKEGEEGEGEEGEDTVEGAYEDGINGRIQGERFGPEIQKEPDGTKDDKDRT